MLRALKILVFTGVLGCVNLAYGQQTHRIDTLYPVHSLDYALAVYPDSTQSLSLKLLLDNPPKAYLKGDQLPRYLEVGTVYWGRLSLEAKQPLTGWALHLEDYMIGPPAWAKSNGKLDVYAYAGDSLLFHQKTGLSYPRAERAFQESLAYNRVSLADLPVNTPVTLLIRVEGNAMGYPPYFNMTARSSKQAFYHEFNQVQHSFNVFLFGVTFIIFLYHLLQFFYLRERIYLWFSTWLFFCTLTQGMTSGMVLNTTSNAYYILWLVIATSILYSYWFFGRAFVNSKEKFPRLDKLMLGLALFVLLEILITGLYTLLFKPQVYYTAVGPHYIFLNIYTVAGLILSFVLLSKKDRFARYFGVGSLVGSLMMLIGTLWSLKLITPPFRIDPFAASIFLQIIIFSFGIAYRRQTLAKKAEAERLETQRAQIEIQRVRDLDELKTRFFTNISHEFRTPLTLIQGIFSQAKPKKNSTSDAERIELPLKSYEVVARNTRRLESLIDELLELAKLESGTVKLTLHQGDVVQFVRALVFSYESLAERKNISLSVTGMTETPIESYYDPGKLEKIVVNILSNAFKYSPEGGSVSVAINHANDRLSLVVADTGKGIPEAEIPHIFDRFYRTEGSEAKGSGIGLALCKELVAVHGGEIHVSSTLGKGTSFTLQLPTSLANLPKNAYLQTSLDPYAPASPEFTADGDEIAEASVSKDLQKPHILVVEDNADLRNFIKGILQDHYEISTAVDGEQGEELALKELPDLVLSDVMMPKKSGLELCHNLKNNTKTSHIPVILLTAKADHSHKMDGLQRGADSYLTKPFQEEELLIRIKNLLTAKEKLWQRFKNSGSMLVDDLELNSLDDAFLQQVFKSIEAEMHEEDFSVEKLAQRVGFSRTQLHRKLKALIDKSPSQLLNEIRLNKAHQLLTHKTGSVSEIAYAVGFSNMSYFTKRFKEKFGETPSTLLESDEKTN